MEADLLQTIARRIGSVPVGLRGQVVECPGWNSIGIRYPNPKKMQLVGRPSPSQVNSGVPCQIGGNPMPESCSSPRNLGPAFGHAADRTSLPGQPDRHGKAQSRACTRGSGCALEPLTRRGREGEIRDLPAGRAEPVADSNAKVAAALEKAASLDFGMLRRKLAEKMNRSAGYLNEVEGLYRRFLALKMIYRNRMICPTEPIGEFWHAHILDTRAYERDCRFLFGEYLHHFPYLGMRGPDDMADYEKAFAESGALFIEHFGMDPYGAKARTRGSRLIAAAERCSALRADRDGEAGASGRAVVGMDRRQPGMFGQFRQRIGYRAAVPCGPGCRPRRPPETQFGKVEHGAAGKRATGSESGPWPGEG